MTTPAGLVAEDGSVVPPSFYGFDSTSVDGLGRTQAVISNPKIRLASVIVRGSQLRLEVQEAVSDASLSWATDQVTELSLTVADPEFAIWRTGQFARDTLVVYRDPPAKDVRLRITAVDLDGGSAGTGGFVVKARSEAAWKLKRRQGPLVMPKASPTQFVEAEAKACGLKVVAQPSATRVQVARDVPAEGEGSRGSQRPSSWTTIQRLAGELGYLVFEFGDTIYFGKPSWLMARPGEPVTVSVPFSRGVAEQYAAISIPQISVSEDAEEPVTVQGVELHRSRASEVRPGKVLHLRGLHPFIVKYLITSLELPLLGTGNVTFSASTPIDPPPQPPQETTASTNRSKDSGGSSPDANSSGAARQSGTRSAMDFVTVALSQAGDRYVFGAEARKTDPDPDAFDCSELIEWACARVGLTFVDGSAAQIAAAKPISVDQGFRTRGALLYKPGHIGISLGDGRSMEARNARAGVGVFRARDIRWTRAGLVPGLRYQ